MFEDNSDGTSNSVFLMRKQYCECPESQYGEFCEKNNELCGGKYCQNGGDCFEVKLSVSACLDSSIVIRRIPTFSRHFSF
jgi:hypothetical protein